MVNESTDLKKQNKTTAKKPSSSNPMYKEDRTGIWVFKQEEQETRKGERRMNSTVG